MAELGGLDYSALNRLDYIVLLLIILSAFLSFIKGFVASFFSFLTWFGAALFALHGFEQVKSFMLGYIADDTIAAVASGLGAFILGIIILSIIGSKMVYVMHGLRLGPVDRSLGFAFGIAKGAIVSSIGFLLVLATLVSIAGEEVYEPEGVEAPGWLTHAQTRSLLQMGSEAVRLALPVGLGTEVEHLLITFVGERLIAPFPKPIEEGDPQTPTHFDAIPDISEQEASELINKLIEATPKQMIDSVYASFSKGGANLTSQEKSKLQLSILRTYKDAVRRKAVDAPDMLLSTQIMMLEKKLTTESNINRIKGYNANQRQSLDRLIEAVE